MEGFFRGRDGSLVYKKVYLRLPIVAIGLV